MPSAVRSHGKRTSRGKPVLRPRVVSKTQPGAAASLQAQQRGHGSDSGGKAEADPALRGQVYPMLATILFAVVVLAALRRWLLAGRVG